MSLTNQDIQAISALLDKQKKEIASDTERKITTAVTNVNRETNGQNLFKDFQTVSKLRSEIQTTEDNLKTALKQLRTDMNKDMDIRFDKVNEALTKISQDLIKYIGEIEVYNKLVRKNLDSRIRLLEKNSAVPL